MSERHNILAEVWTDEPQKFGDIEVGKPSSHRLNVLMRRRNKWISERPREQTDLESLAEWFFVLSRSKEELTKLCRVEAEECELIVDEFLADVDEAAVNGFREYLGSLMAIVEAGAVRDAEPGKPKAGEALTHVS